MTDVGIVGRFTESLRDAWRKWNYQAVSYLERTRTASASPELLFLRARSMVRSGALDMAARLYADAVALDPSFAEAIEAQGEVLDVMGQRAPALKLYEAARKVRAGTRPGVPDRHFVLRQRGHFVHEIMAYDAVLRSLKKNSLPYVARGNAYLASGRPEKALADYARALRLRRNQPEITALRGEALSMMGRFEEAIEAFDFRLAVRSDDAEVLSGRAIARMALGRVEEANADWRQQFELLPDAPAAGACVALRLADYEAALSQLERALMKEPRDPYWRLYRLTAQRRLRVAVARAEEPTTGEWPGPLLEFHAGRMSADDVLKRADTSGRRAEALFQAAVLAFDENRATAERHWKEVVKVASPSMIEHAAARNELSRLGS